MKLKKIKTFVVGNPPPHFGGRYWTFCKTFNRQRYQLDMEKFIQFHFIQR